VVANLTNVRYLTGFTGSAGLLLVTQNEALLTTDGRYRTQSSEQIADSGAHVEVHIVDAEPDGEVLRRLLGSPGTIGLESETVSWSTQRRWAEELGADRLVPTIGVVAGLRLIKDIGEASRIRTACDIADRAFAEVRPRLGEGPTEIEFALELDARVRSLGADDLSFDTIVASGPNGAKPHHRPGDRRISEGDLVVCDFGALVDGYHSDMTRAVAVGDVGPERRNMLEVVLEAQNLGVLAVADGVPASEVDATCRQHIERAGLGETFVHSTGHGVGLDIHEDPRLSVRSTATLSAGFVVTVEPGVYVPGVGGVRIEDTVLVTEDGCDRLTLTPKDPVLI
jgi:Xaa-Pro aminopeptidase